MDPVNSLHQISQLFRKKLAEKRIDSDLKTGSGASAGKSTAATGAKLGADEIRNLIKSRIAALAPEERDGQQAALIFVESILAWEFGDAVLQDPKFSEMSKEVQISISESAENWAKFQRMLRSL